MTQKKMNPAPRISAGTGFGLDTCGQPVSDPNNTTSPVIVERLRRRFGLSREVAIVVAALAGLKSGEALHG